VNKTVFHPCNQVAVDPASAYEEFGMDGAAEEISDEEDWA
jgi:hypothetical protein